MSIVIIFLKVIGWFFLSFLVLLGIGLFLPVSVEPLYHADMFWLWIRVAGIRFAVIHPNRARKKHKKAISEDKAAGLEPSKEKEASKSSKRRVDWTFIRSLLPPVGRAARLIFHNIHVTHIDAVLVISGKEPDEIGSKTGKVWAVFGEVAALLQQVFGRVSFVRMDIIPDFTDDHTGQHRFGCRISSLPIFFVAAGCIVLKAYLKVLIKKHRDKKKSSADNPTTTDLA